jgi:predicted TIM-barrel fold metal-dependent hydrolase
MVEEWCGESGGRLIPLCLIPLWDPELAAAEVRRNAERGVRAVCFSEQPANLDLPSIHDANGHWEPFFAACNETSTVICMHEGSGSRMPRGPADAPAAVANTYKHIITEQALTDWLFSGVLARHPNLKITFSEGQVGWIPYILYRADRVWEYHVGWNEAGDIPERPSTYYWNRVYGCFFDDQTGLDQLDAVGRDQITFEVDYPHADGTWPNSREVIEKMLGGLDDETAYKIVRGNTIEMLGLDLV